MRETSRFNLEVWEVPVDDTPLKLALDIDGDGTVDVTIEEGEKLSASSLLDILEYQVGNLDLKPKDVKKFDKKIIKVRKALDKEKVKNADKRLDAIVKLINKSVKKDKITSEEVSQLMRLIIQIKSSLQ